MTKPKIGWDNGHGIDSFPPSKGIYKNGKAYEEHDFNSKMAIKAKALLELNGFEVVEAQPPFSKEIPLGERRDIYIDEDVDLVVSSHANWNPDENVNGTCIFTWTGDIESGKVANHILNEIKQDGDRLHGSGRHISKLNSWTNLFITRRLPMKRLLIENGFMNGNKDFELIFGNRQDEFINRRAKAIVRGICNYYGKSFVDKATVKPSSSANVYYRVQVGAFKELAGVTKFADEVEKRTKLEPYITELNGWMKVQVGAFSKKENADRRLSAVQSAGYKDAFITTKTGKAVQLTEPYNDPIDKAPVKPAAKRLAVDGAWGPSFTKALQRHYGTPVDGVISGQPKNNNTKYIYSVKYGKGGSMLIRAIQRDLGTIQDGEISYPSNMIKALQKKYGTPQTGKVGNPSALVKEMQKRYNENRL